MSSFIKQIGLLTLAVFFFVAIFTDRVIHSHWARVAVGCIFTGVIGFINGYRGQPENRDFRKAQFISSVIAALGMCLLASTCLSGIYDLPVDERYPAKCIGGYTTDELAHKTNSSFTPPKFETFMINTITVR